MKFEKELSKKTIIKNTVAVSLVLVVLILCAAAARANSNIFVVLEGESRAIYNSSKNATTDFLAETELTLPESKYFDMPESAENGIAVINILNKNIITATIDGEVRTLYAIEGITISDLLADYGITLGPDDILSVPLDSSASDGLSFELKRVVFKTVEEFAEIPFSTKKRPSANLNRGTSKTVEDGKNGSKKRIFEVKTENGKEVSRKLISETVVTPPTDKIVEYGTKEVVNSGVVVTKSGERLEYKNVMKMTATAYTTERTSDKITATGKVAKVGLVAVDPKVIPLGSRLYITSSDGKSWIYGTAVAADTGVRGKKIDLFFDTYKECINFGRRSATVYILK